MNPRLLMTLMSVAAVGLALEPAVGPAPEERRRGDAFRERVRSIGPLPISMLACARAPEPRRIPDDEARIVEAAIGRREAKAAKRAAAIAASKKSKLTSAEGASV